MKSILFLISFVLSRLLISAQNPLEFYQKGSDYKKAGNYKDAIYWYAKGAALNDSNCLVSMAELLLNKNVFESNKQDYLYLYNLLVELENTNPNKISENYLGWLYQVGYGVDKDYSKAIEWYKKSASNGYAIAQNDLGNFYYNGISGEVNYKEAVKWFAKAADQGYYYSEYNLGYCFQHGEGVDTNYTEAVKWYRKAADQDYVLAEVLLGDCYYYGLGINQSYDESKQWYQKAADKENSWAMYQLGRIYEYGKIGSKNLQEAVTWYYKAVDKNQSNAMINLGNLYFNLQIINTNENSKQNYEHARDLYVKADSLGNFRGSYQLGLLYFYGMAVSKNIQQSIELFKKSADQGYDSAMLRLGDVYQILKSPDNSMYWYEKAAAEKNAAAMYMLGKLNEYKAQKKAIYWFEQSYQNGYQPAALALWFMYSTSGRVWVPTVAGGHYQSFKRDKDLANSWRRKYDSKKAYTYHELTSE